MTTEKTIRTDVLVLGAGAAGHAAALAAEEAGAKVVQLYKGAATTAISTGFVTFPVAGRFEQDEAREAFTNTVGKGLCDMTLLNRFLDEGGKEIQDVIDRYDIPVDEAPRGVRARLQRGRTGREVIGEDYGEGTENDMTGLVMEFSATHGTSLFSSLLKAVKASTIERIKGSAFKVLPDSRTVVAIVEGEPTTIQAKSIIFATGGIQALFEFTDSPRGIVGDGLSMALEAGLTLTDLEFIQFYPLALAEEDAPSVFLYPDFPTGGRIINDKGEDLITKYYGDSQTLGDFDNWDHLAVSMHREALQGQKVYVDYTSIPAEDWDANSLTGIFLRKYAPDFADKPVRVAPIAHYTVGGIRIDAQAASSAQGIYAAGEVAGGMHGANRHGGASLAEGVAFGRIAGRNAAAFAKANDIVTEDVPDFEDSKDGPSFDVAAHVRSLRKLNQKYLGPVRDSKGLAEFGDTLATMKAEAETAGWSSFAEFADIQAFLGNLNAADAMRLFMERREESRGVHARADFPELDDAWLKKQVAALGSNGDLEIANKGL